MPSSCEEPSGSPAIAASEPRNTPAAPDSGLKPGQLPELWRTPRKNPEDWDGGAPVSWMSR